MCEVIKNYRNNDELRKSFNELAEKTFGLTFEDWYQNGFWGENYNPYSIVIRDKIVANVSVNKTNMKHEGVIKHFLQLGTVMTDPDYRNQGLIRKIMNKIDEEYKGKTDGIYLFASDSVLEFYPKFGFEKAEEHIYSKKVKNSGACQMDKVIMNDSKSWNRLVEAINHNIFCGKFDMIGNPELIMFYVTKFMQEDVFYHEDSDTYVIAEAAGEKLFIYNIFSSTLTELDKVFELFGTDIKEITLGFTPKETKGFKVEKYKEEDCTFFIKGDMRFIDENKLRIPSLSHA